MIDCQIARLDDKCRMSELEIYYSFHDSPFGRCLIAFAKVDDSRENAVCHLSFADGTETEVFEVMRAKFLGAKFHQEYKETTELVDRIFNEDESTSSSPSSQKILILLKGTDFQMDVWEALVGIPAGTLTTYAQVAQQMGKPKATRAVAGALKANQIGYLIPCHRVVCKSGCNKFSWGAQKKIQMQEFEKNHVDKSSDIASKCQI